jgi:hypothetical protein
MAMDPKNPITRWIIMILLMGGSLYYVATLFYYARKGHAKNVANNFKDTVQFVQYDYKGTPEVVIGGKRYYLTDGYTFDYKIEKGDSLIKQKGLTTYKLVKKRGGAILLFNQ